MERSNPSYVARKRRQARVRKSVSGTRERPRLNVFRSLNHIYAQVIDDTKGETLVSACTLEGHIRVSAQEKNKMEKASMVGKLVAERALEAGISQVVFDRGGYKYHGQVKALAEASREAGLKF